VLVVFDEPVKIDGAAVKSDSGRAATKLCLEPSGRQLLAEFDQPLAAQETLVLEKITDRAQAPNEMAAAKAQVVWPDWPSNPAGVCYLWKNARTRHVIFDERIGLPVTTALSVAGGKARFDREGVAIAEGGLFAPSTSGNLAEHILDGIKKTHQFSFEIVVASADLAQTKGADDKPLPIFNWSGGYWGNGNFWLIQEKNLLQVGLSRQPGDPKPEVFDMAALPDTQPHHVIVSCAAKRLAFCLDGKKVKEIDPSPAQLLEMGVPMFFAGYNTTTLENGENCG